MGGRRAVATVLVLAGLLLGSGACSGDDDDPAARPEPRPEEPSPPPETTTTRAEPLRQGSFAALIPRPSEVRPVDAEFILGDATVIRVDEGADGAGAGVPAQLLHDYLAPATGLDVPVLGPGDGRGGRDEEPIVFTTTGVEALGDEGYELRITPDQVEIMAAGTPGFGWAVQTLRQLLPPEIEAPDVQPGTWSLPAGTVRDRPRFAWRGAMLDVARHFFPPADVERVIDLMALYKLNRLHLHLTDDQGWRLEIKDHPELTEVGSATELGGGPGGFYTQDEYRRLVDYAAARGIVVVPEIDVPGHTTAALASLPELNCGGASPAEPPEVETEFSDGSSSLCDDETTYRFVETVVDELATLTPGPYIHLGGDEARATSPDVYRRFVTRARGIVEAVGKRAIGWDEIATTPLTPDAIVQHWYSAENARAAADQGASVIMSPASRAYMDMKYDRSTPLGLTWAGTINTRTAYEWDPATVVPGLPVEAVLGLEAPLWTETVTTLAEIEQMMLPRLPGYAELGWSSPEGRSWDEYRQRLAAHAARWAAGGRTFTPDPTVPFPG